MTVDVLIVEDAADLAETTRVFLEASGLSARTAHTAQDALQLFADASPHSLLLDINLPDGSGFDLCRHVRRISDVPIIFISARSQDEDQILALALGGDDYVTKPFSLAVLAAKVRRAIARTDRENPSDFDDGRLRVDEDRQRIWIDGEEIVLTTIEDRLLRYLVSNRGRVVSKQDIIERVWGDSFTSDSTLTVHVRRLRSRIESNPDKPTYIRTVWGRGYLFEGSG